VYCINAARHTLSEEPTRVWASATKSSDARFREVEETVTAVMRFKDERIASFTCSFGAANSRLSCSTSRIAFSTDSRPPVPGNRG
jgi:hypothetical protein